MDKVTLMVESVKVEWVGYENPELKTMVTNFEIIEETLDKAIVIIGDAEYSKEFDGVLKAVEVKGDNRWAWRELHTSIISLNGKKPHQNWVNSIFNKAGL